MVEYAIKKNEDKIIRDFNFKNKYNKKVKSIILYANLRINKLQKLTED